MRISREENIVVKVAKMINVLYFLQRYDQNYKKEIQTVGYKYNNIININYTFLYCELNEFKLLVVILHSIFEEGG